MSIFSQRCFKGTVLCNKDSPWKRGFTLIELLVVISIMVIVTSVILVRQSRFDSSTVLRSLAYSVALSVRQAQIYGSSVLGTSTPSSLYCVGGNYSASGVCYAGAYGINFSIADPQHYYLFADLDNNGCRSGDNYTCSGAGTAGAEDVNVFTLGSNYEISNLCVLYGGNTYCSATCPTPVPLGGSSCSPNWIKSLTILFHRPNPEACITDDLGLYCAGGVASSFPAAFIQLASTGDLTNTRSITVTETGEISVCALGGC